MKNFLLSFFKSRTPFFYCLAALCLLSFIAECAFIYIPQWESPTTRQEKIFKEYWEKEGAAKFQAVGLEPTEELFQQELELHLKKALATEAETDPDLRLKQLKREFSKWWQDEGKDAFINQGIIPDESIYKKEERKFLNEYKSSKAIYSIRLEAANPSALQILSHWILFPNILVFLLCAAGLLFSANKMSKRFGGPIAGALFAASIFLGALLVSGLAQTSFFARADEPYSGLFLAMALCLGSICIGRNKNELDKIKIAVATAIYLATIICTWIFCSQIFVAAIAASIPMFGGGIALGIFLPERKKSKKEIAKEKAEELASKPKEDPIVVQKKTTRKQLMEGFESAMRGDFILAKELLGKSMHSLLLETPVDSALLIDMAKKLTNPNLYIEVSSTEWAEWGMASFQKKVPEAALYFLDKSLLSEKEETTARKTLLYIGGIRLRLNMDPELGIKRLEKVISLKNDDLFAEQAKKLIDKFAPAIKAKKEAALAEEKRKEEERRAVEEQSGVKIRKLSATEIDEDGEPVREQSVLAPKQETVKPSPFSRNSPFSNRSNSKE